MSADTQVAAHSAGFAGIMEENRNRMTAIEQYRKAPVSVTKRNLAFGGAVLGGLFLVGLIGAQIITGVIAIATAIIGGGALFYLVRTMRTMDPVIQQKLKNKKIELMVKEARTKAVEQLDNQVLINAERLKAARKARDDIGGMILKLKSKLKPENEGKPNYQKKVEMIQTIESAYEQIKVNIDKGAHANVKFEQKVREYKEMDEFAEMAGAAMAMLNAAGGDKLAEMLSLEAFDAIETEFNSALVSIESTAHDMQIDMED